ncbi:hypothetical protein [Aquipuribacter nitratireducens]|uniref:Uncharacterized protein n=1 Tax=Aquipuribacter nitratireducens TaxID=650104 RepID=A0ABW0GLE3_9MICO
MTVRILGLPLDLAERAQEHHDGLAREMALISLGVSRAGADDSGLPARFLEVVRSVTTDVTPFRALREERMAEARARGETSVDIVYEAPTALAEAVERLRALQAEVDAYCRQGRYLLTLETPPDVLAYRMWLFDEFTGQIAGRPPRRWVDTTATPTA